MTLTSIPNDYRLIQRELENLLSARLMGHLSDRDTSRLETLLADELSHLARPGNRIR